MRRVGEEVKAPPSRSMAPDSGKCAHGKLVLVHATVHGIDPEDLVLLLLAVCPSL